MHKICIIIFLLIFNIKVLANSQGKELFENNCAFCHTIEKSQDTASTLAPALPSLIKELRKTHKSDKALIKHIKSFVFNPKESRANHHYMDKYGLMPSQEEIVSKRDLNIITKWIAKNYK